MEEKYYIFNQTRQSFLHLGVSVADTSFRRLKGLVGRLTLRSDEGLWVMPSQGIHTIGLFFPIDVIYLSESCQVIHLIEHMKPFRLAPIRIQSRSVLELPARTIYTSNTQVGDQLMLCTPEQMTAYWTKQRESGAVLALDRFDSQT
jgi:uncharacterized membrane protein (UPF0127 family)